MKIFPQDEGRLYEVEVHTSERYKNQIISIAEGLFGKIIPEIFQLL